ncbi:MAG: DUF123 domain-containing protein [Promethearchaeota archaeon]
MKGSYILVVFVENDIRLIVGALGEIVFRKGFYLYVGSAMGNYGSSALLNRVKRHLSSRKNKSIHWHIDYLLAENHSMITKIYLIPSIEQLECIIAQGLSEICDDLIRNFGSSDCMCISHLFYFNNIDCFSRNNSNI